MLATALELPSTGASDPLSKLIEAAPILTTTLLGLAFASVCLSVIVALAGKDSRDFLIASVIMILIAGILEIAKMRVNYNHDEFTHDFPSKMFEEYVNYKTVELKGSADLKGQDHDLILKDIPRTIKTPILAGKCFNTLLVLKPPAILSVDDKPIENETLSVSNIDNNGYSRRGRYCGLKDTTIELVVQAKNFDSEWYWRLWNAESNQVNAAPSATPSPSPSPPPTPRRDPFTIFLCTGEHEGHCPGPHTNFLGCPNQTAEAMIRRYCQELNGRLTPVQTNISGDNCGYSVHQIDCF